MHALRECIQERMGTQSYVSADLAPESGLSLRQLPTDVRGAIANRPKQSTVARALRVREAAVMQAAFAAMGYELAQTARPPDLSSVLSAQLLRVLVDRLGVTVDDLTNDGTAITQTGCSPADELGLRQNAVGQEEAAPGVSADTAARVEYEPSQRDVIVQEQDRGERPGGRRVVDET